VCDITCRDVIEDGFLEDWSVPSTGPGFLDDCVFIGVGQTDAQAGAVRMVIFEITTQLHFVIIAKGCCLMLAFVGHIMLFGDVFLVRQDCGHFGKYIVPPTVLLM